MSLYVCGYHTDFPVSWKGTGCPKCEQDKQKRQHKKDVERARKKARREGVEYVEDEDE